MAVSRELRYEESQNFDSERQRLHNTADEYLCGRIVGGEEGQLLCQYMLTLAERLSPVLGEDALVRQYQEGVLMIIPSDLVFSSGRTDIRPDYYPVMDSLAIILQSCHRHCDLYLLIHTDNNCSDYVALSLSERRAKSFFKELKNRGIKHLHYEGKGYSAPLLPNDSEEYRSINRRVEIAILARKNSFNDFILNTTDYE